MSVEELSFVLLSLAHSAPAKILQEGVRAVAILLVDEAAKKTGEEVMRDCFGTRETIGVRDEHLITKQF